MLRQFGLAVLAPVVAVPDTHAATGWHQVADGGQVGHVGGREFPALARVGRTTFARQAANLWRVKQLLHGRLWARVPLHEDPLWLIDSFPVHACKFARAKSCKLFKGTAAFGYDHLVRNTFFTPCASSPVNQ